MLGSFSLAVTDRIRDHIAAAIGMPGEETSCLVAVATFAKGVSIRQLATLVGLSHSATVRLVDRLEDRGLVRRSTGRDRRSVAVEATSEGEAAAARVLKTRAAALADILSALSERERDELRALHAKLLDRVIELGSAPIRVCRLCDAQACGYPDGICPVTQAADRHGASGRRHGSYPPSHSSGD